MAITPGTALNTPPISLVNTMNAISANIPQKTIIDNIIVPSPTLWSLIRRGPKISSTQITYPLFSKQITTQGPYFGAQLLDTATVDAFQPATQVWRPYQQTISINMTDIKINRTLDGVVDIVEAFLGAGFLSMTEMLAKSAWHISPFNTTTQDVDDLDAWVRQTTNNIAGIDRAANTFWRPQANVAVAAAGTLSEGDAEKAYLQATFGYEEPDTMTMSHTVYQSFKAAFTQNIRFEKPEQNEAAVEAGFKQHFMYNNAVVIPERYLQDFASGAGPSQPNNTVYMWNSRYLKAMFLDSDFFQLQPWDKPTNQEVVTTRITVMWNIANNNPRTAVALTGF